MLGNFFNLIHWYRKEENKVYIVDTVGVRLDSAHIKEYLLYDFTVEPGSKWYVPVKNDYLECDYADTILLESKNDTITTSAGLFMNCCSFMHYYKAYVDAGIIIEWFVGKIGRVEYIQSYESGEVEYYLRYAYIVTDVPNYNNSYSVRKYMLFQNYPNPFNPTTTITLQLPERSFIVIDIFDVLGRRIETLANDYLIQGYHSFIGDASKQTSGVYFCKLHTNNFNQTIKLIIIR